LTNFVIKIIKFSLGPRIWEQLHTKRQMTAYSREKAGIMWTKDVDMAGILLLEHLPA
jgi:hypothetical protein